MENYILRIYRRDERYPERVVGVVEDVETGERLPFRNLSELITILSERQYMGTESRELEQV